MRKTCKNCQEEKSSIDFPKHGKMRDGHLNICKACKSCRDSAYYQEDRERRLQASKDRQTEDKSEISEYKRQHYQQNKEKILKRSSDYYENNKEEVKERRRKHYQKNKEKIKEYNREYGRSEKGRKVKRECAANKRKTDINYRLSISLRSRLSRALKGNYKSGSAVSDLGLSIDEFKVYIAEKFQENMTWENWGKGPDKWHLDHILPLVSFDLTNHDQFLQAVHYTNYQPLWSTQNLEKHASIPKGSSTNSTFSEEKGITRVDLTHLYTCCKMTYAEIAEKYDVSESFIQKKIKEFQIEQPLEKILTEETLTSMIKSRKKVPQIAQELGTTEASVFRYMKKYGLSSKWHRYYDTEQLQAWADAGLSSRQIGEKLGLPKSSAKSLLKTKGISTATRKTGLGDKVSEQFRKELKCRECNTSKEEDFLPDCRQICRKCSNEQKKKQKLVRKREFTLKFGGECKKCGNKEIDVLNFYYLGSTRYKGKHASLAKLFNRSMEFLNQEVKSTTLLCKTCYKEDKERIINQDANS